MELFELKRIDKLTWDDIPFINTPAFASYYTFSAMNFPSDIWRRIINIREFISAEFGTYNPLSHYRYAEDRVRWLIQSGQHFCISRSGKPFDPAFIWKEDPNHPHQGEWTDPQRNYWMNPTITDELARIGHRWHKQNTQSFMDELLDSPYAIAREAEKKVMAVPKAVKAAIEKPLSSSTKTSEPTSIAPSKPAYKVLKGKYGTLHDYGDYIVQPNPEDLVGKHHFLSSSDSKRHCYTLGDGFGLGNTTTIKAGKKLTDFGGDIPHGTLFATFIDDGKGNLVYPSRHNGLLAKYSPHLFIYDANEGGLIKENGKYTVSVIEQWAKLPTVAQNDITNDPSKPNALYKHLEKYHAVTINPNK